MLFSSDVKKCSNIRHSYPHTHSILGSNRNAKRKEEITDPPELKQAAFSVFGLSLSEIAQPNTALGGILAGESQGLPSETGTIPKSGKWGLGEKTITECRAVKEKAHTVTWGRSPIEWREEWK